ncbi:MAG: TonB-dependent receptor [Bryobacter sp.]|nr:TonB-dependent receptor [Bryobacter sp.]
MLTKRLPWRAATVLVCLGALGYGQSLTSLRGTVKDTTGAVIPDVVVTVSNESQGYARRAVAGADGVYQFPQIAPGTYVVKAEKQGFATVLQNNVTLLVSTPASLDLTLEVGNVSQTIAVEAEAPALNTQDASIGNAFQETQVRQLPLVTRNVVELLSLQAGVTQTGEVLGARRDQNNVVLDGADVNDNQSAGAFTSVLPVPLDSVQEFRVTVGGQGAALGRSSGGQVSLVTKGGSNSWHGSAYEFHRNTVTSANNWFSNRAGIAREALIRNQFGASLGGPIKKDRVFFFVNWENRIDASAQSQTRTVPSETFKQGIVQVQTSDGVTRQLSAAEMANVIDPQRRGFSPFVRELLARYPAGNDPSLGSDGGLNFSGLRFNAPFRQDDKAYVARFDFRLDNDGKHNLYWRGTLADNKRDQVVAQFPGQAPAAENLNNSRGFGASYTGVVTPSLTHQASLNLTRQGLEQSGSQTTALNFAGLSNIENYTRGFGRVLPTWQFTDDLTWLKGKHTIQGGINFRWITNNRFSYSPSFPTYGLSRGTMLGLGSDITNSIVGYLRTRDGLGTGVGLRNTVPLANAVGTYLGMLTNLSVTYQYDREGNPITVGAPQTRRFKTNEYEFYLQDTWRVSRSLLLTFGLRYSNNSVPYEADGLQVNTTFPLDAYFGERVFLQTQGVASNAMPNARLQYALSGPANNGQNWWARDNNNWAPRFSFAYSPRDSKFGVLRGGAAMVYDRFGSDMITNFDQLGSVGLASRAGFPRSYNMTDAPRVLNGGFPALPPAEAAGFPSTPPDVFAVAGTGLGMFSNLKTPYSFVLNATYGKEIWGGNTIEVGYAGRLGRKLLLQGDLYTPLNLTDPKSGVNWIEMSGRMRDLYEGGLTPGAVRANPGSLPLVPYVENMWPTLANAYFPGSATANYYYHLYNENDASDMDALHLLDRVPGFITPGQCVSAQGCHTFFARQGSALPTWMNAGLSSYHGMTLSVRRPLRKGFSYDFNYTWSHSIDNGSGAESEAGQFGGILQSVFFPRANRGSSDFDIRHNVNFNSVYELPFGKGRKFLSSANPVVNQLVGGWSLMGIMRYRTALPLNMGGSSIWNTNYWFSSRAIAKAPFTTQIGFNNSGQPGLFPDKAIVSNFIDQYPGTVGTRAIVRGDDLMNVDLALGKRFFLPWEGHSLQLRGEAFNAFNQHYWLNSGVSLALSAPATFGQFTQASSPRVFQFALRYEF